MASVDELLRETARQLDPDGSRFAFTIDTELPLVRADPVQLERAFANLMENALRYSPACRYRCEHESSVRTCGSASSTAGLGSRARI